MFLRNSTPIAAETYLHVLQPERALGFQALWRGLPDTVAISIGKIQSDQ